MLAIVLASVLPVPARAAINPCANHNNYFAGYQDGNTQNDSFGASTNLRYENATMCTTQSTATSSAWSMIAPFDRDGVYIQSGFAYLNGPTGPKVHFSQMRRCNVCGLATIPGSTVQAGETHHAWQQWDTSCQCLHSNIDTTTFQSLTPGSDWSNHHPWESIYMGEVNWLESDVPGTASANALFLDLQREQGNGSWVGENAADLPPALNAQGCRWGVSSVQLQGDGLNAFSIDTYAYPSQIC